LDMSMGWSIWLILIALEVALGVALGVALVVEEVALAVEEVALVVLEAALAVVLAESDLFWVTATESTHRVPGTGPVSVL